MSYTLNIRYFKILAKNCNDKVVIAPVVIEILLHFTQKFNLIKILVDVLIILEYLKTQYI